MSSPNPSPLSRRIVRTLFQRPPRALPGTSLHTLILAAERRATQLAGTLRGAFAVAVLVFFALIHPPEMPLRFILLVVLGLCGYAVLSMFSVMLARATAFRPWMATALSMVDLALFLILMESYASILNLPLGLMPAVPPFMFGFVLLALAAMRYSALPVALTTLGIALGGLVWIVRQSGSPDLLDPWSALAGLPLFGSDANFTRLIFVVGCGAVLLLVVRRSRTLLVEAIEETDRNANLSRYLPRSVARLVAESGLEALGRGRVQKAAILFADIVGFTSLAERMAPEALASMLGEIRSFQRRAIEDHGGVVDKFIGDCVMAVFGIPAPDAGDAARSVTAALAMEELLAEWNRERMRRGEVPIAIGIGIHFGDVMVSAIGDAERLEYATLGDTVNVAQRVEALTRDARASLLVTQELVEAAGAGNAHWEALPAGTVRGRTQEVRILRRISHELASRNRPRPLKD